MDRLVLRPINAAKNHFELFVAQRHQIVGPGDSNQSGNIARRIEADLPSQRMSIDNIAAICAPASGLLRTTCPDRRRTARCCP
jgi:hypothetical protein